VYGYHPVLIEPISTLVLGSKGPGVPIEWRWYGVHPRDCAFFAALCGYGTQRIARVPVSSDWRYLAYKNASDVAHVEHRYRVLWEAERAIGHSADLLLCMELRDAYFLWRVSGVATIYYPAIIFLQDEALNDFGAAEYLRQFEELSRHDVLALHAWDHGDMRTMPPTGIVAQSAYIAEGIFYHVKRRVPAVRPLALYIGVQYAPNSTQHGTGLSAARLRLMVLCARTRLMMSHVCRILFREGARLLPRPTSVRLFLPSGDGDVVHGLPFSDVASFDATILIPWNIAVTTFAEMYAMHMPLFVPDELWLARLWPKQMTSYQRAHPDLHRELRTEATLAADPSSSIAAGRHPTPYPSFDRFTEDYPAMRYWAAHYGHVHGLPGVRPFRSIPALLLALHRGEEDLRAASAAMREEALRARGEVLPFWAGLVGRLLLAAAADG